MPTKKRDMWWGRNTWSPKCSQELIRTLSSRVTLGLFISKTFCSSSALLIIRLRIKTSSRVSNQIWDLELMRHILGLSSQNKREEPTQQVSPQTEKTCYSPATRTRAPKSTRPLTPRSTPRTGRRTSAPSGPPSVSSQQCNKKPAPNRTCQGQVAILHSRLFLKSLQIKR